MVYVIEWIRFVCPFAPQRGFFMQKDLSTLKIEYHLEEISEK